MCADTIEHEKAGVLAEHEERVIRNHGRTFRITSQCCQTASAVQSLPWPGFLIRSWCLQKRAAQQTVWGFRFLFTKLLFSVWFK